jgi:Family of unknown function (DUF6504)
MRCYAEPVDVHRQDTTPDQFLWRGRLYVVREVLAHWLEAGGWWRRPAAGVDDGEREFWRVEAGCGRSSPPGVYDLCFDWSRAVWTVACVLD